MDFAPLGGLSKRLRADSFRVRVHFFWLEFDSRAFQGFVERLHRESEGPGDSIGAALQGFLPLLIGRCSTVMLVAWSGVDISSTTPRPEPSCTSSIFQQPISWQLSPGG